MLARTVLAVAAMLSSAFVLRSAATPPQQVQVSGATLRGLVVTADDRPVRRAHVVASGQATFSADTGPDGVFQIDGVPAGSYEVAVSKKGFLQTTAQTVTVAGDPRQPAVRILMSAAAVITGRVVDRTRLPLAGAGVLLRDTSGTQTRLETDDRGIFRFHTLHPGTYEIWPGSANREDAVPVTAISGRETEIELVSTWNAVRPNGATVPVPQESSRAIAPAPRAISGRVTSAETGLPIPRAAVQLFGAERLERSAEADDAGRFMFTNLTDGQYLVRAGGQGNFVELSYGQRTPQDSPMPILVAGGKQIGGGDIALPETKVLAGRLIDEFGDPAPDVIVALLRSAVVLGKTRFAPISDEASSVTNDAGEFRLRNVPPGDYLLTALPTPFGIAASRRSEGLGYGFAATFFPGTSSVADAQLVIVGVRGVTASVIFQLVPSEVGDISGRLVERSGAPVGKASIRLSPLHDGDVRFLSPAVTTTDTKGEFLLRNVPVGSYVVHASYADQRGGAGFASRTLTVSARNTTQVELIQAQLSSVRGRLVFEEGPGDPTLLGKTRILPTRTDFVRGPLGGMPPHTKINDDGTFEVSGLEGPNKLSFGVPLPWMLVGMSSGGRDVTDQEIDGDISDMVVRFAPKATTVVCRVPDKEGRPISSGLVIIMPLDASLWAPPSRHVRGVTASANGDFTTSALPPGAYRAIAYERAPRPDWMNPAFLQTIQSLGESFTVALGESRTVQIVLRK